MEITLTRELVELKHDVLVKRINDIYNKLKDISSFVECENEIKSIEIIKEQYERMYQAVLENEEYDKYKEVEDFIISQLAKVEKALDKIIYKTAQRFDEVLQNHIKTSRESDEYNKFYKLDIEIEKIKQLKAVFKYCSIYFTKEQESRLTTEISTFKFEMLIRRQIEQMVYQNGTVHDGNGHSRLMQFNDKEEQECFYKLLDPMLDKNDEVLKDYTLLQIMSKNRLLNHLLFGIVAEEICVIPKKYIGLLDAPIFNPHMCNIADDPFKEEIPYAEIKERPLAERILSINDVQRNPSKLYFYKRKKANLSLLKAVLKAVISKKNTTIMECDNVYQRFGFECRPIVISEGQEIVWQVYQKTKHMLKPKQEVREASGIFAKVKFVGYDYDFKLADEQFPFFTQAALNYKIKERCAQMQENSHARYVIQEMIDTSNYLMSYEHVFLSDMQMVGWRRNRMIYEITGQSNDWERLPLNEMDRHFRRPRKPYTTRSRYKGFNKFELVKEYDETELWESYKADFEEMGITVEEIGHEIFEYGNDYFIGISLDDIADLPIIDFEKAEILTAEQLKKAKEEYEEER